MKDFSRSLSFGDLLACRAISSAGPKFIPVNEAAVYWVGVGWEGFNLSLIFKEAAVASKVVFGDSHCLLVMVEK